jgi:hypothetical protein
MVIKSLLGFGMMIVTNTEVMRPRDPNPAQNQEWKLQNQHFQVANNQTKNEVLD